MYETNPYHYLLTTLLVIDDSMLDFLRHFECPCQPILKQMEIFINAIREKTSTFIPDVFMSDDAPAFFSTWKNVMGEHKNQLLCSWHVDKNWRQALVKIKHTEKRANVYKFAKAVQEELNNSDFCSMLERF